LFKTSETLSFGLIQRKIFISEQFKFRFHSFKKLFHELAKIVFT